MDIFLDENQNDSAIHLDRLYDDFTEWASPDGKVSAEINEDGSIDSLTLTIEYEPFRNTIAYQIIDQFRELQSRRNDGVEIDDEDISEPFPYDPERIRVEPYNFSVKQTVEMINEGDIDLNPDFQRHFVWRSPKQKSRLIESALLRIPLPVFYLSQDNEGLFQVIDGLQRLTVLTQFFNNKFKLKGLEYLKDLEGCTYSLEYSSIPPKYKRRFERTQLAFYVIDPQTPTRVKFEIFKRINQGGKSLNPQEIRNCIAKPRVRKFIKTLATSDEFIKATSGSVNPVRMADQELVLRFIGFYLIHNNGYYKTDLEYNGTMSTFLDDVLSTLNNHKEIDTSPIKSDFMNSMKLAHYLFGKYAFRKYLPDDFLPGTKRKLINNSLFTSWSVILSDFSFEETYSNATKGRLIEVVAQELSNNQHYFDVVSYSTNHASNIDYALTIAKKISEVYL